jgi:hypothetical protein
MRSASRIAIVLGVFAVGCGGGTTSSIPSGPMPDNGTYTGVYFSPQYGEMHMVQNGNAVVGKFKKDERSGKIQGEAEGNVLRFEWIEYKAMVSNRPQETRGKGYFQYLVDSSNGDHVLKGRWGLADDDASGGEWNAYKSRSREPDLDHFGSDVPTEGGEDTGSEDTSADDSLEESSGSESGGEEEGDDVF